MVHVHITCLRSLQEAAAELATNKSGAEPGETMPVPASRAGRKREAKLGNGLQGLAKPKAKSKSKALAKLKAKPQYVPLSHAFKGNAAARATPRK